MAKKEKKPGDGKDGRKIRTLPPISKVSPYIMKTRNGASNLFKDTLNVEKVDDYIREKKDQGYPNFSFMHVMLAAYVRTVAARPALNRFIRGQRVYTRDFIEIALVIKKEMTLESPDTVIKATYTPDATAIDIYNELERIIEDYRNNPGGDFDETAKILNYIPGLLMKFTVWVLNLLDYFGALPRKLTKLSPFHGSFFITSMGSLGIPPVFHHLYNFGNIPIFVSFGAKQRKFVVQSDGSVRKVPYIDYTVVTDERICDGYYFASSLRMMKNIMKNPWVLDTPPETVEKDIK